MNSPVLRKLATALVAVLLLFYIGYQLYNANYASVQTEVAEYVSADDPGTADVVQVEGLVLRKEKVLTQEVDGVVAYVVEDGGRIQKDGTVGEIFSSQSDAAAQQQIEGEQHKPCDGSDTSSLKPWSFVFKPNLICPGFAFDRHKSDVDLFDLHRLSVDRRAPPLFVGD